MPKIPIRPIVAGYLGIGIFLMVIRVVSLASWAGWHLIYRATDGNGGPVSYLGTCIVALRGTLLMPLFWPIGIWWWIKGPASLSSILLYPWFALPR